MGILPVSANVEIETDVNEDEEECGVAEEYTEENGKERVKEIISGPTEATGFKRVLKYPMQ